MKFHIDPVTARAIRKNPHRAADIIHSLNDRQVQCKKWMVEELERVESHYAKYDEVYIIGSWYGQIIVPMLLERLPHPMHWIELVDPDEEALNISKAHWLKEVQLLTPTKLKILPQRVEDSSRCEGVIICTSCEHMPPFIDRCTPSSLFVLQSNNYREVEDHVNCVDSAEELAAQFNINRILFSGKKDMGNYTRFMVIGYQ